MKPTWYTHRKVAKEARINFEHRTAKALQKERPNLTWTDALHLARLFLDQDPVL